ncbi:thioredoxin family protein [bacterium]|nr:thioredoxin family protein [bacterium]
MKNFLFACLGLFFFHTYGFAQAPNQSKFKTFSHSQARLIAQHNNIAISDHSPSTHLAFQIKLNEGWHTYWKNPGDSGAPATLTFTAKGLEFYETQWPTPVRIDTPPLTSFAYKDELILLVPIRLLPEHNAKSPLDITLDAQWLVCKEECVPEFGQFELKLDIVDASSLTVNQDIQNTFNRFNTQQANTPIQNYTLKDQKQSTQLNLVLPKSTSKLNIKDYDFLVEEPSILSYKKPKVTAEQQNLSLEFEKTQALDVDSIKGLLLIHTENTHHYFLVNTEGSEPALQTTQILSESQSNKDAPSLWLMIIFAFIGGAILNLMPCVFPIISLKLISLVHHQKNSYKDIRKDAGLFIVGCITCFQSIALCIVALKQMGLSLGWGFQLQSPWFILTLSFVFLILALSFVDLIHIELPGLSKLNQQLSGVKKSQSFFTGFLAVLLASPCSAPFMGVSLGYALTQTMVYILVIFLFLGLGFTLPYLYIFFFPKHIPSLPKSGPWLNTFKHILFFPMLATLLWLSWLYGQLQSINHMFWLLFSLLFFASVIFILKFKRTLSKVFLYFILIFNLSIGIFALNKCLPDTVVDKTSASQKYSGLWLDFSPQTLQNHLEQKHHVFIDFTADWCVTCKVNESITFNNKNVLDFVETNNIVMIKADWTHYDASITDFLKRFNRASVPLYIYYHQGQNPIVLPEILTPKVFMDRLTK